MDDVHRPGVGLACRVVSVSLIGFDAAFDRLGKAWIDFHRCKHEQGIDWSKEHAGRRDRHGAVYVVENSVAENAVPVEVVGDRGVEGLIKVEQPFGGPARDRQAQNPEGYEGKDDSGRKDGERERQHKRANSISGSVAAV